MLTALINFAAQAEAKSFGANTYAPAQPAPKRFSAKVDTSASRTNNELADYLFGVDATFAYEAAKTHKVYLQSAYSQPNTRDSERLQNYGFEDTKLGYIKKDLVRLANRFSIDADAAWTLPTAATSQRASLISALTVGAAIKYPLGRYFFVTSKHHGSLNFYQYETADDAGYRQNYPWLLNNGLGLGLRLWQTVTAVDYSFAHLKDYGGTTKNIQTLKTSLSWSVTKQTALALFGQWRDRTLTNNALFDSDTRIIGTSLSLSY